MPLTLVLGPANSAKAGEVLGAYGAAARRGALLVVPTAGDARYYERELVAGGVLLGSVLTFSGLASEIARRAQYSGRRLSPLQRERVLTRALRAAQLDPLAGSAQAPGFTAAAGELIAELQRSLVTPQRFAAALRSWAAQDPRRGPYAHDVAGLYLAYAEELDRLGRVDAELFAWRALDALRRSPGRWGTDPVFFYGFDDLTALERDAVETLSRIVGAQVTVSLTYEAGRPALTARAEAVAELRPLAERVLELPALDAHYEPGPRAALHHLERSLFSSEPEVVDPGSAVELLEAGGERAEAELVAAEVLKRLRAGVPGEQIAVVCRSLDRCAPLLTRVFAQYGIALASRYDVPCAHTPLGRGLLGLARCALLEPEAARAEDLIDYLRAPGRLERPEVADALEAAIRRDALRTATQARERLGWTLGEIDALAGAGDPATELARRALTLFAAPHRGRAPALDRDEELDARALAALLRALEELSELGQPLTPAELIELLETLPVAAGQPPAPGAVLLAEPLEIRARRFRAVFVCGLQEGEFPRPATPEPFLSDERRRELATCSGLALRPREDALARERYLFYACVSRATEFVGLSYRSSDEEGNLALPSPFLADVSELLVASWPQRRRTRLLADVVWAPDAAPTPREQARARACDRAPSAGEGPAPVRRLGAGALAHVRHRRIVSAGALENYADCPVRWLVERELQPTRFEPEPEPITRGNLMHAALEQLLRRLRAPVTEASLPQALAILDDVLDELSHDPALQLARGRPDAIRAAALRAVQADLIRYLDQEASDGTDWRPDALELRFGFSDERPSLHAVAEEPSLRAVAEQPSLPALALGDGTDPVLVRGMIDRVDVGPGGEAIVRDYKSGGARQEQAAARWGPDRRLQVALYMLVLRELSELTPVAGFYQPLRGESIRPRGIYVKGTPVPASVYANDAREPAALHAELDGAAERAIKLAHRLRAGELIPCPQTCSRDGCAYPGICRSQ
jgi:RecB family exonuclease